MKLKIHLTVITLIFIQLNMLHAQQQIATGQTGIISADTVMEDLPESIHLDWLSTLESWHVNSYTRPQENCLNEDLDPEIPDSLYLKRVNSLPFAIPMPYNETVRKCIDLYTGKLRNKVRYMMGMSYYYFPMMEEKLDKAGLPVELKYLTIVESALNPVAQSRMGAYGLWQFMLPTARNSGLEINSLIDERLDPERATDAACIYLQKLYDMFKDWHLAIAAYNCGEGNVLKAIRRSGGVRDFWQIYSYLPRETRAYVPLFIAAAYVMENHEYHGICPIMPNFSVSTDTVMVSRNLPFDVVSDIMKIDKDIIKFYNPQYKREIVPGNVRPSVLRLPMAHLYAYVDSKDSLYSGRLDTLMTVCQSSEELPETVKKELAVAAKQVASPARTVSKNAKAPRSDYASYTVKSGDTLSSIARRYKGTTVKKIQSANGMTDTKLRIGQILKIPQA